ncbi:MAG: hypothetical protein Q9198_008408, partial [Flavoplaca austrocitrina]
ATADQAFTNAKAARDVDGMANALIYAALETNIDKVELASILCTATDATNPEIAAISQNQVCETRSKLIGPQCLTSIKDPAPPGPAPTNKALTLELAGQIASVGGDPQEALQSGTFAPGELDDSTAAGKFLQHFSTMNLVASSLSVEDTTTC